MAYQDIEIEPNSYKMQDNLEIPLQTFYPDRYKPRDYKGKLYDKLPEKIKDKINYRSRNCIWGSMERRLDFIKIPDPGKLSSNHCIVADFKDRLARLLFLLSIGFKLDWIRLLHNFQTDREFAIELQFLRDNGIDIN